MAFIGSVRKNGSLNPVRSFALVSGSTSMSINAATALTLANGTILTNEGAVGPVSFNLAGAAAMKGKYFEVFSASSQTITVQAVNLVVVNNDVAQSLAWSAIGGHALVFSNGTSWCALGDSVGVTYTVA